MYIKTAEKIKIQTAWYIVSDEENVHMAVNSIKNMSSAFKGFFVKLSWHYLK